MQVKFPDALSDINQLQKIAQSHDVKVTDLLHPLMAELAENIKEIKINYNCMPLII